MLLTRCLRILSPVGTAMYSQNPAFMASNRTVSFLAEPSPALVDDKTRYSIHGLTSGQKVTVAAELTEGRGTFMSHAHYEADDNGQVDLNQQPSAGGSYTGVKPMGLLWAMKSERGSIPGLRLAKKDPSQPFNINISVLEGHHTIEARTDLASQCTLCSVQHPRTYQAPGVRRIEIKEGRLRGALYLPSGVGDGPYPGVIDLFGTAGGLVEFRSALLASRGFASLALAYFDYDDLSPTMSWDMEYFEEAVDFMTTHPLVKPGGIGTIAVSKGTELINYMAIYSPLVKAVVCIGPYHYYSFADHYKNGKKQVTAWPDWEHLITEDEGLAIDQAYWKVDAPPESLIEIEKAEGAEFLFVNGEDDRCAVPEHADILIDRLKRSGKHNYRQLRYPRVGHLIEPPYTPHARSTYHKLVGQVLLWGGEMEEHAAAQEHSWTEILEFFSRRLNNDKHDQSSKL